MLGQDTHTQWQGAVRELPKAQHYLWHWHLMRLEGGARRLGFGSRTSNGLEQVHASRSGPNTETIVLGCFVDGHLRGAVELSWQRSKGGRRAELSFTVEERWQGRGVGTALMAAALAAARERGIVSLCLTCHALNRRMQRIAERFGGAIGFEGCECFADLGVGELV